MALGRWQELGKRAAVGEGSDPLARRVSAGCVVVPVAFYDNVVQPLLGRGEALVDPASDPILAEAIALLRKGPRCVDPSPGAKLAWQEGTSGLTVFANGESEHFNSAAMEWDYKRKLIGNNIELYSQGELGAHRDVKRASCRGWRGRRQQRAEGQRGLRGDFMVRIRGAGRARFAAQCFFLDHRGGFGLKE